MEQNFNLYSRYYDLLYRDKAYSDEVNYVLNLIEEIHPDAKNILELGCGSGNHALYFSQKGFSITGLDRSEWMIAEAKTKAILNFQPIVANITNFELNTSFEVVISLFHVMSYLTENEELNACLKQVNKHLTIDGLFIFDCWFTPAVYHLKPSSRVRHFEDETIKVKRVSTSVMDLFRNTIDVNFDIHIEDKSSGESSFLNEKHIMRHFSIPEMEFFASQNGFKILNCEELLTKKEPDLDTWAVCFTLQKISEIS